MMPDVQENAGNLRRLIERDLGNGRHAYRMMIKLAYSYLGDLHVSEEVALESMFKLYNAAEKNRCFVNPQVMLHQNRGTMSWLSAITENTAKDALRCIRRRKEKIRFESDGPSLYVEEEFDSEDRFNLEVIAETKELPEDSLIGAEGKKEVLAAVSSLPERLRMPTLLHYIGGMPYTGIAGAMNLPVGTVKSRIHSGILSLRNSLESLR